MEMPSQAPTVRSESRLDAQRGGMRFLDGDAILWLIRAVILVLHFVRVPISMATTTTTTTTGHLWGDVYQSISEGGVYNSSIEAH